MNDDEEPIIALSEVTVRAGASGSDDPTLTLVRCGVCGAEGTMPTAKLPLLAPPGLTPMRDADGVRLGACAICRQRPNRAQRRKGNR